MRPLKKIKDEIDEIKKKITAETIIFNTARDYLAILKKELQECEEAVKLMTDGGLKP